MNMIKRKLNCLIIEQDEFSRQTLSGYVNEIDTFELIRLCRSADEALRILGTISIDMILVDVQTCSERDMEYLRLASPKSQLVLLTNTPLYHIQQPDEYVFDCIVKPITLSRFKLALTRVASHLAHQRQLTAKEKTSGAPTVIIKSGGEQHQLYTSEIIYIESDGEYLKYHTGKGKFMALGSLKKLANDLGSDFIQVHRSYVVNRSFVLAKTRLKLELTGNRVIPIGKTYRNAFQFVSKAVML